MFLRNVLAACLVALSSPSWAAPGHSYDFGQPAPAAKATRSVEVVMGDMSFTPKAIDIKAGETVRFVLVNKGQLLHEFNLGDAAMHAKHQQEMLKMQENGMLTPTMKVKRNKIEDLFAKNYDAWVGMRKKVIWFKA